MSQTQSIEKVSRGAYFVVAAFFALLHSWFMAQAVINLLDTPAAYANVGLAEHTPWLLLVGGVVIPPLAYLAALFVSRRVKLTVRAVFFALSLTVCAAASFSLYAFSAYLLAPVFSG